MIGQFFFWLFHIHKWKIIKNGTFNLYDKYMNKDNIVETGTMYVLQCEKCGNIKQKKISVSVFD